MSHVNPSIGTVAASILTGLLGSAEDAAAQSQGNGTDDLFSFGFDTCLEILRTQDAGDALRANRERAPNSLCIGASIDNTDVLITICDDARDNPDAPVINTCIVRASGLLDVSARLDVARWAERMQAALSEFDGVVELQPRAGQAFQRYGWCENDEMPFYVDIGTDLPGHPAQANIYTFGTDSDPMLCEQE